MCLKEKTPSGVHCACCGQIGRKKQGCSCQGGKSHQCLKELECPPCGKQSPTPTGSRSSGYQKKDTAHLVSETESLQPLYGLLQHPREFLSEIVNLRWNRLVTKVLNALYALHQQVVARGSGTLAFRGDEDKTLDDTEFEIIPTKRTRS